MEQDKKNHPGTAAVLSFIFNGLGQLYNGQIFKGLVIIFFSAVSMLVFIIGSVFIGLWLLGKILSIKLLICGLVLFCTGLVSICILGIYSILDAYRVAVKK
jgi:TM2 domain-containing membrane protein YozV